MASFRGAILLVLMVRYLGENLYLIRDEIARWRDILAVPYQEYLLSG